MPGKPVPHQNAVLLYGLPASGKSTVARALEEEQYFRIGASDAIRYRFSSDPRFRKLAEPVVGRGDLIDERELIQCVKNYFSRVPASKHLLLDGVARTAYQTEEIANFLRAYNSRVRLAMIHVKVSEDVSRHRMEQQAKEQDRIDASPESRERRIAAYNRNCSSVLSAMANFGQVWEIDGEASREEVAAETRRLIGHFVSEYSASV